MAPTTFFPETPLHDHNRRSLAGTTSAVSSFVGQRPGGFSVHASATSGYLKNYDSPGTRSSVAIPHSTRPKEKPLSSSKLNATVCSMTVRSSAAKPLTPLQHAILDRKSTRLNSSHL